MNICFTTLAIGEKYYSKCNDLISSINNLGNFPVVVLTDNRESIRGRNIIAVSFSVEDINHVYHAKIECLKKCRDLGYEGAVFVDADALLSSIDMSFETDCFFNGILASGLIDGKSKQVNRLFKSSQWQTAILTHTEDPGLRHVYEMLFYVALDDRFDAFYSTYNKIKQTFLDAELYKAEGVAYAIALAQVGEIPSSDIKSHIKIHHKYMGVSNE